jgi:hypothetical protein
LFWLDVLHICLLVGGSGVRKADPGKLEGLYRECGRLKDVKERIASPDEVDSFLAPPKHLVITLKKDMLIEEVEGIL